jgi:hypothetical protein
VNLRFEVALRVGDERRKKICLVIRIEAVEYIVKFDGAAWDPILGPVDIVLKKSWAQFLVAIQQHTQDIDNGGLADVVRADDDVQTRLEQYLDLLQLPKIANSQFA